VKRHHLIMSFLLFSSACAVFSQTGPSSSYYSGMCDASAAVYLDSLRFIVANDEDNLLRVYRRDQPGAPLSVFDLGPDLDIIIDDKNPEMDIEGATWLNDRIFWITSHGRNKVGEVRPNRYRLFATSVRMDDGRIEVKQIGFYYRDLVQDLIQVDSPVSRLIKESTMLQVAVDKNLAPNENGLNIEGLSASADGKSLLIGFRNPRPGNMALIIEMKNPEMVILQQERPVFGPPILLDLKGAGIRSMEYSKALSAYIIVAGTHKSAGEFQLYCWSGRVEDPPEMLVSQTAALAQINSFNPEGLLIYPHSRFIQILSDDGDRVVKNPGDGTRQKKKKKCRCKDLFNPGLKSFRDAWVEMDLDGE
jgi:hypothetical protein